MNTKKKGIIIAGMLAMFLFIGMLPSTVFATGVDIPDANFKAYLNKQLGQEATADISAEQLETIKSIELPSGVKDISGVEYCTNLTFFRSWEKPPVANMEKLGTLTSLQFVTFNGAGVEDIRFLANLTDLTYLNFYKNNIVDVSVLQGLTKLKTLDLCHNGIYDMSSLAAYVDAMPSYVHLHGQQVVFNEECACGKDPCTKRYENPVRGIRGEVLIPQNVVGATYHPDTNDFTLDEGANVFTYRFEQQTKPTTQDFENYFSGTVTVNITHVDPVTYNAVHRFVSLTEGKELPAEVTALLPGDLADVVDGTEITPTAPQRTTVAAEGGKWTFEGYTPETATINGADVSFEGGWSFVVDAQAEEATPASPKTPAGTVKVMERPKTGDSTNLLLWTTLLLASALAIGGTAFVRRTKKSK